MGNRKRLLILLCIALPTPAAHAGMPNLRLTDIADMRVEAISFFLLVFLLSALAVQFIWNRLRRDFIRLPKLTYLKSIAIVTLWGLLFILILTMISGARELMTPGAWEQHGATYRLKSSTHPSTYPAPPEGESR
jgi:amino acid transporter